MAMRQTRQDRGRRPTGRQQATIQPVYEDIKPISEWIKDQQSDFLIIHLPGFMKEKLKVSTEGRNIIRVRGERLVGGNKWQRFEEDYQVPDDCNLRGTRARFESEMLTITVPKNTTEAQIAAKPSLQQDLASKPAPKPPVEPTPLPKEDAKSSGSETPARPEKTPTAPEARSYAMPQPEGRHDIHAKSVQKDQTDSQPPASKKTMTSEENPTELKAKTDLASPPSERAFIEQKADRRGQDEERKEDFKAKDGKSRLEKDGAGFVLEKKVNGKQAIDASTSSGPAQFNLQSLKQTVKDLSERDEDRQLLVNVGVSVLVIMALGTYIYNTIGE